MPAAAPRTRKPAPTSLPTGKKAGRTSIAAATRVRVPPRTIVPGTAGPAIKLNNPAAEKDPRFQKVMDKLQKSAAKSKDHVHPARKAAEAMAAAKPPAQEKAGDAQANQVDTMKDAETKKPEKNSFLELLRSEIAKAMPKTLGDTDDFMKGDKKTELKGSVTGNVNQQKDEAASGIKSASDQPPDPSKVESNEATPIPPEGAPPTPPPVGAADATPAAKPDSEVSLDKSKDDANQQLAKANVTTQQLQEANDPRFTAVITAKSAVDKQATTGPQQYRAVEQKTLTQEAVKAVADEKHGLLTLQSQHNKAGVAIKLRQQNTKEKDEADRKKVADDIEKIYNETKAAVDKKLASLDTDVSAMFDQGIEAAMTKMTNYVNKRMDAYKAERYSGVSGKLLWATDKLLGLPDEVNVFYEEGRKVFTQEMDALVVSIANTVETRLKEAKDEVANGQKRISDYVNGLPKNLQAAGKAAEKEIAGRFDEMRQGIDAKKNELAQKLAQRYKEANDKANEKLKAMQEENKGLVSKLVDKLGEVIKILSEFKERLTSMLKKGADTIMLIVAHPIDFLKNLINAIKQGIQQFANNIWTHLKAGFMAWLFGSLAEAGIEIPSDFSLGSILKLVLQVLGLTYDRMRAKAVKLIGERNVALIEKVWSFISTLIKGGPAALWEQIKEFLGNLKDMVINAIQDWVVTTVIKAAITKLATMFNPVGAIVQAIITIYNTVMFFIERIKQIMALVEAIINSVYKIATGDIGSAANWVEQAMARTIPVIIGFLARLLGLSGISDKIKEIIKKVQDYVDKAVDKLIDKVVKGIGKLFGKGKEEEKGKETKDDKDVKNKVKKELASQLKGPVTNIAKVQTIIDAVYEKYKPEGLKSLDIVEVTDKPGDFEIDAVASPGEAVSIIETTLGINLKDLQLKWGTVLKARLRVGNTEVPVGPGTFRATGGPHAEEHLLAYLEDHWNDLAQKGQNHVLIIEINRSPCDNPEHQCAKKLANFIANRKRGKWDVTLDLRMISLYGGQQSGKTSLLALKDLHKKGVKLSVWNVSKVIDRILEILKEEGIDVSEIEDKDRQFIAKRTQELQEELKKIKKK